MFHSNPIPVKILHRIATWVSQRRSVRQQAPIASITQPRPSTRASRLQLARSLRCSADEIRQKLDNFRLNEIDSECLKLEAERCENAARQIEMAEHRA